MPAERHKHAAAARLHFDVVNRHAQRNLRQRQAIADRRRRIGAAHHLSPAFKPSGRQMYRFSPSA